MEANFPGLKPIRAVGLAIVAMMATPLAQAAYIEFAPAAAEATVGDSLDVSLSIGGLTSTELVSGFDLTALFDPALLGASGFTFSDSLGGPLDVLSFTTPGAGSFGFFSLSFLSDSDLAELQGSSVLLGTFHLRALGAGFASFGLEPFNPVQISGAGCFEDPENCALPIDRIGAASIRISAPTSVPEPGSLALLAIGLGALLGGHRWRVRLKSARYWNTPPDQA